jgi:hypothetical protein
MPKISGVGESLVGDGKEVAHVDLLLGPRGSAVETAYCIAFGKPASHGCVRISPENAATLYALVSEAGLENTQVGLAGLTPGGEGQWASSVRSKSRYRVESYAQPQRRGGLFRRLFGRR